MIGPPPWSGQILNTVNFRHLTAQGWPDRIGWIAHTAPSRTAKHGSLVIICTPPPMRKDVTNNQYSQRDPFFPLRIHTLDDGTATVKRAFQSPLCSCRPLFHAFRPHRYTALFRLVCAAAPKSTCLAHASATFPGPTAKASGLQRGKCNGKHIVRHSMKEAIASGTGVAHRTRSGLRVVETAQ